MGKQDGSGRQVTRARAVDDSTATILHVDMDAFFASVELLEHPELVGKPVIVGHPSARSVVTAATYEARRFGVNSAMPMALALRRCPQAIVLEPHFERYQPLLRRSSWTCSTTSRRCVERLGIDEAFLDVSGAVRAARHAPWSIAQRPARARARRDGTRVLRGCGRHQVRRQARLRAAPSPTGCSWSRRDETIAFLHPLPISALWGVGGKTEETLRSRGYATIGDLAARSGRTRSRALLGDAGGPHSCTTSRGAIDPRSVHGAAEEKSVGHEMTFETDVTDARIIRRELLRLSDMVAVRLRKAGMHGPHGRAQAAVRRLRDDHPVAHARRADRPRPHASTTRCARSTRRWASNRRECASSGCAPSSSSTGAAPSWGCGTTTRTWREAEDAIDAVRARFGRGAVRPRLARCAARSHGDQLAAHRLRRLGQREPAVSAASGNVPSSEHVASARASAPRTVGTFAAEHLSPAYPERAARGTADKLRAWQAEALDRVLRARAAATSSPRRPPAPARRRSRCVSPVELLRAPRRRPRHRRRARPSTSRRQWADAAHTRRASGSIPAFSNRHALARRGSIHGVAVTYAQVAVKASVHRDAHRVARTLVILDEVHHGGDALSWGDAHPRGLRAGDPPAAR